jgi:hypothetical protein
MMVRERVNDTAAPIAGCADSSSGSSDSSDLKKFQQSKKRGLGDSGWLAGWLGDSGWLAGWLAGWLGGWLTHSEHDQRPNLTRRHPARHLRT